VISPKEAVDAINERFGVHPGHRALHAKGIVCRGTFTATPEAARLTRAAHMQGVRVPVIARVSNGAGNPNQPDYAPDVRGFAVGFELGDGRADIVAQTAPRFPVRTPDAFIDLVKANADGPSRLWKLPLFLLRNPGAIPTLRLNLPTINPPTSFATVPYFAIHAYKWIDAEGEERFVRYTLLPDDPEPRLSVGEAKKRGRDYLHEEIVERMAAGRARFQLELQIAGPGDEVDDPTSVWPDERQRVIAGEIELTEPVEEEGVLVFDPVNVTDGIELSEDPILRYRPRAYSESVERRLP
jgi:catalase